MREYSTILTFVHTSPAHDGAHGTGQVILAARVGEANGRGEVVPLGDAFLQLDYREVVVEPDRVELLVENHLLRVHPVGVEVLLDLPHVVLSHRDAYVCFQPSEKKGKYLNHGHWQVEFNDKAYITIDYRCEDRKKLAS